MDGYMAAGSELKDTYYDYLSKLQRSEGLVDSLQLYYINSRLIPSHESLRDYILNLTPATFRSRGGDRSSSEIDEVIRTVLAETGSGEVSLLISDFILDKNHQDPSKIGTNVGITIANALHAKRAGQSDFAVKILCLTSQYQGKYYYPMGGSEYYDGERPYYLWIFGSQRDLARLDDAVSPEELVHGYRGIATFAPAPEVCYTIADEDRRRSRDNEDLVYSQPLRQGRSGEADGSYRIRLRADFSSLLVAEEYLADPGHYKCSTGDFAVASIHHQPEGGYTHLLELSLAPDFRSRSVRVELEAPRLPGWVAAVNDDTGTDIARHADQTTGIRYLIGGVADAYEDVETYATFKVEIE